jgi:uncharacterized protein (DUF1697 family)
MVRYGREIKRPERSTSEFEMTVYVAMLRGVNVGGNSLKMDWLRQACENLGWQNVRTYVQSGNIVFSSRASAVKLAQTLKETIDAQTRLPVTVVLRSAADMERIVADNPFLKQKAIDVTKLHVTFLGKVPVKPALDRLDALAGTRDQYRLNGSELYLKSDQLRRDQAVQRRD